MPILKIGKEDFSKIDWLAIKDHLNQVYEHVETNITLFTRHSISWMAEVDSQWTDHKPETAIICQFWLDPDSLRKRPRLANPKRAGYIMRHEKKALINFLRTITSQPWLNIKAVWYYPECKNGIITIHFKVYDYELFWKD